MNKLGIQKHIKKKVRGWSRLVKMHKDFVDSNGEKHAIEFDKCRRLTRKYRAKFSCFLRDLVRTYVRVRFLKWKAVMKELKDKLWYSIKVCIYRFLYLRLMLYLLFFSIECMWLSYYHGSYIMKLMTQGGNKWCLISLNIFVILEGSYMWSIFNLI